MIVTKGTFGPGAVVLDYVNTTASKNYGLPCAGESAASTTTMDVDVEDVMKWLAATMGDTMDDELPIKLGSAQSPVRYKAPSFGFHRKPHWLSGVKVGLRHSVQG